MLYKNHKQRKILWAESGVERWWAAPVAKAILRRISRQEFIELRRGEVYDINRIHEVLRTGRHFNNPFQSLAADMPVMKIPVKELGFED